jgi:hypothetical protein
VMFANAKINKWFAVRVVRLVLEDAHIHRLSLMKIKYLKEGNQC